jgi:hypothetical protein
MGGGGPMGMLGLLNANLGPANQTFVVTNLNDSGPGSLRQAILYANASPGYDFITFQFEALSTLALGGLGGVAAAALGAGTVNTITLTSGELEITDHVAIIRNAAFTIVRGSS